MVRLEVEVQGMSGNHSTFHFFYEAGYDRLLPVAPHDSGLTNAGKRPGLKGPNGWYGMKVGAFDADEERIALWAKMGAGVGLRCDTDVIAIDIDTLNPMYAERAHQLATQMLGPTWQRIGRAPKVLLPYRIKGVVNFRVFRFNDSKDTKNPGLIELLAGPHKWFVVDGVHPKTGKPYHWPNGVPEKSKLPEITPSQLEAYFQALGEEFPGWKGSSGSSPVDRSKVNQESLRGDPLLIRKAMEALPNDRAHFGYDEWRNVGTALRAALPDDVHLAEELFEDWSDKADIPPAERLASAYKTFHSLQPPFALGANLIYDLAAKHNPEGFSKADVWFDEAAAKESESQIPVLNEGRVGPSDTYEMLSIDDIFAMPDPVFLIKRYVPQDSVGFIFGDPGTGKSFLSLDMGLSVAFGLPTWFGDPIKAPDGATVIYIAAEGAAGLKARIHAWRKRRGLTDAEWNAHKGRFRLIRKTINFLKPDDVGRLLRTAKAAAVGIGPVAMIFVDTVSRSIAGGDENSQKEGSLFVEACTALRAATAAAVVGVHHTNKQGGMRGSTTFPAGADFVFKLERKKAARIGSLLCEKMKDGGADGWSEPYSFEVVDTGLQDGDGDAITSLVVDRAPTSMAPDVKLTKDAADSVLAAMGEAWAAGSPWSMAAQSKRTPRAVKVMVDEFGFTASKAEEVLQLWIEMGVIEVSERDSKSHLKGLRVLRHTEPEASSLFD